VEDVIHALDGLTDDVTVEDRAFKELMLEAGEVVFETRTPLLNKATSISAESDVD